MKSKGYKKLKAKGKITLSIKGSTVVVQRDVFERETGDTDYIQTDVFTDTAGLDAEKAEIEALLDDINEMIIDVQKELNKLP